MSLQIIPIKLISHHSRCPRTLDDGVVGHRLHVAAVVIKRQVPNPGVQVLDESGLVDGDRVIHFAPGPVLLGDEPAAVQQLHKVVLQRRIPTDADDCYSGASLIKSASKERVQKP